MTLDDAFATYDNSLAFGSSRIAACRRCGWWCLEGFYSEDDSGFSTGAIIQPEIMQFDISNLEIPTRHLVTYLSRNPHLLHRIHPRKLEQLVGAIFRDVFDCQVEMTKRTRDGGKDLVCCRADRGRFLVEVKRYEPGHKVGVALVQRLTGVVYENGARTGLLVTTSDYTRPAIDAAERVNSKGKLSLELHGSEALLKWLDCCATRYRQRDIIKIARRMESVNPRIPFIKETATSLLTWSE